MKLQCVDLPNRYANCMVAVLGGGKSVKFHKGCIVDLKDPALRLANIDETGHTLLGKYSKFLRLVHEEPIAQSAPVNKSVGAAPRRKS